MTEDSRSDELRAMILDAALHLATAAADIGEADSRADAIQLADTVDVQGVDWHLMATYHRPGSAVRIIGHMVVEASEPKVQDMGPFSVLFLGVDGQPGDRFDYSLPVSWLRAATRAEVP